MSVVSLCPLRAGLVSFRLGSGAWMATLAVKATFELRPGEARLAEHQEDPNEEDNHWNDDAARSVYAPSDFAPFKKHAEVVLVGYAFADPGKPARSLVARLAVGDVDKSLEVHADRAVGRDGELREGPPFSRMPLRYERAAAGRSGENPVGIRGDRPDASGGLPVANVQALGHAPAPADASAPAGFGPIAESWPERRRRLGPHAPSWQEVRRGARALPDDVDPSYFQCAPGDQWMRRLREDEVIHLEHLHPHYARLTTRLPGVRPRVLVDAGGAPRELALSCDTLWIDNDRCLATLTWRASLPAAAGARVVVAMESPGRPVDWSDVERRLRSAPEGARAPARRSIHPTQPSAGRAGPAEAGPASGRPSHRPPLPSLHDIPASARAPLPSLHDVPASARAPTPSSHDAPPRAPSPSLHDIPRAPSPSLHDIPASVRAPMPSSHDGSAEGTQVLEGLASLEEQQTNTGLFDDVSGVSVPDAMPAWLARGATGRGLPARPASPPSPRPVPPAPPPPAAAPPPPAARPAPAPPAPPPVLQHAASAAAAGVLAASAAAADAPASPPSRIGFTGDALELLWFDPEACPRVRRRPEWREILDRLEEEPSDPELDEPALGDEPAELEDRREIFEVLARGAAAAEADIEGALAGAIRRDGRFAPRIVLLAGEARFEFDELETLRATISTASPLAGSDAELRGALDAASAFLATPGLLSSPSVSSGLTSRVREAFVRGARDLPPTYLEDQIERALLERRAYQRRPVFGAPHLRALFFFPGSLTGVPAYFVDPVSKKLPLFRRLRVRLLAEVHFQADQYESHAAALRVVAVARAVARGAVL